MSEKIDLEFSANDSELSKKLNALKRQLDTLSSAGDMSSNLNDNLSAIRQNIELMKQMTAQTRSARLEMEKLGKSLDTSTSNTGNARQRKKNAKRASDNQGYKDSIDERVQDAITIERFAKSKANSRTINSFAKGYGNLYEQRTSDTGATAYQRAQSKYDTRAIKNQFSNVYRDFATANRGLADSDKRISNLKASGGYVTPNQYNTAMRNITKSRDLLTNSGMYSSADDHILANNAKIDNNKATFGELHNKQNALTATASSEGRGLTQAEKEIVKVYQHKQKLLLEENDGLQKLNERIAKMNKSYDQLEDTLKESSMQPTGGLKGTLFSRSRNVANSMIFGSAATLGGLAMAGNNIVNQNQPMTRAIGANNGTYNSRAAQLSAQNAGRSLGLTGSDILSSQMAYMEGAGYTNQKDMNDVGVTSGMFAKLTGMTVSQSNALTSTYGKDVNGASAQGLKDLQNTFYGSLKQAGLTNNGYSQANAMSGILGNYGALRGGDISNLLANGQVQMQSALGSTGNKSLMGANGANFMNQMNSSIIGQGADSKFMQLALMNSNPQKYNGSYKGFANIIDQTQNGLDGENLKAITQLGNQFGGGDKQASASLFSNMLRRNFGVNVTSNTAGDIQKLVASGQLDGLGSKDSIKKMQSAGIISSAQAKEMQQKSSDATYDKGQANFEKAATAIGDLTRRATSYGLVVTGGSALLMAFGAAVTAATVSLAKLAGADMLSSVIKGRASGGKGGNTFLGGSRAAGEGGGGKFRTGLFGTGPETGTRAAGAGGGRGSIFTRIGSSKFGTGVKGIANSASSVLSTVADSSVVKTGGNMLSKYGGKALGVASVGLMAYDTYNNVKNAKTGKDVAGGIGSFGGSIAGGTLGMAIAGPFGAMIGAAIGDKAGNILGKSLGGLFDNFNKKDKGVMPDKSTKSALGMVANNIGGDDKTKRSYVQSMLMQNNGLSSSDAAKEASKIVASANQQNINVNVNGTVRHKGEVEDTSQLNNSKNTVLKQIFAGNDANKTKDNN